MFSFQQTWMSHHTPFWNKLARCKPSPSTHQPEPPIGSWEHGEWYGPAGEEYWECLANYYFIITIITIIIITLMLTSQGAGTSRDIDSAGCEHLWGLPCVPSWLLQSPNTLVDSCISPAQPDSMTTLGVPWGGHREASRWLRPFL